jgi:hypothetical protein
MYSQDKEGVILNDEDRIFGNGMVGNIYSGCAVCGIAGSVCKHTFSHQVI